MKTSPADILAVSLRVLWALAICVSVMLVPGCFTTPIDPALGAIEEQLTFDYKGHYLNHTQCFSPDDEWIVYDTRIDPEKIGSTGSVEKVNIESGEMIMMYTAPNRRSTDRAPGPPRTTPSRIGYCSLAGSSTAISCALTVTGGGAV